MYYKIFRFDRSTDQYVVQNPSDPIINNFTVPQEDSEVTPHMGFTETGRTNSFNLDHTRRDASVVSS